MACLRISRFRMIATLLLVSASQPAFPAENADYSAGVNAYKSGDYKMASQKFHAAVSGGCNTAAAWLYLGHSYNAIGDRRRAAQVYKTLTSKFSGRPEAKFALQSLNKIAPSAVTTTPARSSTSQDEPAAATTQGGTHLLDRITIQPPKQGHAPVSAQTVDTVRDVVKGLPAHIAKLLDEGGAKITIAPNMIDIWPANDDPLKPGSSGLTMGEEPVRVYNHDIYIYEREKIRGSSTLKEPRSEYEIRHSALVGIGHALNDCAGALSADSKFKNLYKLDVEEASSKAKTRIAMFAFDGEVCAELIAGLLGGCHYPNCAVCLENMPRVKQHLKDKLKL